MKDQELEALEIQNAVLMREKRKHDLRIENERLSKEYGKPVEDPISAVVMKLGVKIVDARRPQ